ncbi:MAG: Rne/Rng family ribonuclease [Beijerinckiaceae bacterium]|nr:Rne/Rng family ribonuclease [Beijerinckiaceae bacterium]
MSSKMLIDASHPEETRVVVLRGNRVEEFDFEAASKKQLRGNIYLAKVMRVEPSLQAAFVDYGGNRHGFLAFTEIHPDYYQIPVADRQALIDEEARAQRDEEEDASKPLRRSRRNRRGEHTGERAEKRRGADPAISEAYVEDAPGGAEGPDRPDQEADSIEPGIPREEPAAAIDFPVLPDAMGRDYGDDAMAEAGPGQESGFQGPEEAIPLHEANELASDFAEDQEPPAELEQPERFNASENAHILTADRVGSERVETGSAIDGDGDDETAEIEQLGGDAMEEMPVRPHRPRKQYKIQEVIKRRQVLLVQVVKEERGNKGAALTTYLSLAGRYSVLMPNTARGGGISRKITDQADRKRLKSIAQELEVPEGMGVIVRTAGAARTRAEVKRDFEYLLRMWETVRETTLRSSAPTLVYEEGSLIKRSIRDLYNKDIDEIVVAGDEGYREAKEFMRLLMPSHAKMVQPYRDCSPIFTRFGVETQLDAMFSNHVTLKSGGYIVINQTEALVAIDVNSGRSTREHNIEDTALRTNLEAADEISRQLRLRDLAGLIVIDFIDMEESRNNRTVERRLKEALKNDRARIQIGRMSHFGLLEMSRQRMRAGVIEGSTIACPHCAGSGTVRATASISLHVLRALEDALIKNSDFDITVKTRTSVALYILNQKRSHLRDLEKRFGVSLTIDADDDMTTTAYYALKRGEPSGGVKEVPASTPEEAPSMAPLEDFLSSPAETPFAGDGSLDDGQLSQIQAGSDNRREGDNEANGRQRRRRRRRRGRGADREGSGIAANAPQPPDDALEAMAMLGGLHSPTAHSMEAPSEPPASPSHDLTVAEDRHSQGRSRRGGHAQGLTSVTENTPAPPDMLPREFAPDPEPPAAGGDVPASGKSLAGEKRQRGRRTPRARRAAGRTETASAPIPDPDFAMASGQGKVEAPGVPQVGDKPHLPGEEAGGDLRDAQQSALADTAAPIGPGEARTDLQESSGQGAEDLARPKRSGWWQRARVGWRG